MSWPNGPDERVFFSAIEHPPLAYLLTFNEVEPDARPFLPCGGLHNFGQVPYAAVATKTGIDLLAGFRETPVPGEYGQSPTAPRIVSLDKIV